MSFKCPQIFIKRPSLTVCTTWSCTFLWIFLNLPTAGSSSVRVNGLKTTRTLKLLFCPWSNCFSAVVGGVAAKNHGNVLHAMEKSVHYISKVKNVHFHTAGMKWFWMHIRLRKSQKALTKRTHSRETWDCNAVKSVLMDATWVAGGISGRVLFFGVGASQIGIFAAHFAAKSRQLRRLGASRPDQLGHELVKT